MPTTPIGTRTWRICRPLASVRAADHLADRVGQGGDVAQRLGDGGHAGGVEAQAVLEAVAACRARGRGRGRARWPRRRRRWRPRGRRRGCAGRRPSRRATSGRVVVRRCGPPRRARGPARRRPGRSRRCGRTCHPAYAARPAGAAARPSLGRAAGGRWRGRANVGSAAAAAAGLRSAPRTSVRLPIGCTPPASNFESCSPSRSNTRRCSPPVSKFRSCFLWASIQ